MDNDEIDGDVSDMDDFDMMVYVDVEMGRVMFYVVWVNVVEVLFEVVCYLVVFVFECLMMECYVDFDEGVWMCVYVMLYDVV